MIKKFKQNNNNDIKSIFLEEIILIMKILKMINKKFYRKNLNIEY